MKITVWRMLKTNKGFTCILCGESIAVGEYYLRPPVTGLDKRVSPKHKTTWGEHPPYFHKDCFCYLREGLDPAVPVTRKIDYEYVPVPDYEIKSWCQDC